MFKFTQIHVNCDMNPFIRKIMFLFYPALLFCFLGCTKLKKENILNDVRNYTHKREATLNRLHNDINRAYGFIDGVPRVNSGPCGRFARDFRDQWNALFDQKVNIVFAMTTDLKLCYHVLVKLPDGNYYDGGNGVFPGSVLYKQFPNGLKLLEMKTYDYQLLDKWSYSLTRSYKRCPDYSDDTTRTIIARHLAELVR